MILLANELVTKHSDTASMEAYAKTWSGVKLWSGVVEWSGFLECFFGVKFEVL